MSDKLDVADVDDARRSSWLKANMIHWKEVTAEIADGMPLRVAIDYVMLRYATFVVRREFI